MIYGYIYKITTTKSNKVYIGQTTKSVEERYKKHLKARNSKSKKHLHLYLAMNKYGIDTFSVEQIDTAENQQELNNKEIYWINFYDSINNGYNMAPGGVNTNIFTSEIVKENHANKMRSIDVRNKISKTMHELRTINGFSDEHKTKIKQSCKKRKEERASIGLKFYDDCSHCATRSIKVYCILDNGSRYSFDSIWQAGKWWYEVFKPFGEIYSSATYQRKIEASINGNEILYHSGHSIKNKGNKDLIIKITNIKWFKVEEVADEKSKDTN